MSTSLEHLRTLTPAENEELAELRRDLEQNQVKPSGISDGEWQENRDRLSARMSEIMLTAERRAASSRLRPPTIRRGYAAECSEFTDAVRRKAGLLP